MNATPNAPTENHAPRAASAGAPTSLDGAALHRFVDEHAGCVTHHETDVGGSAVEALVTEHGYIDFAAPPLERHMLLLMLDGVHRGIATAEGLATSALADNRPGRLSFLPHHRACQVLAEGRGRYLKLLIDPAVMRSTMEERVVGGADASLFAFNTIVNPRLERHCREVADAILSPGNRHALVADDLAQRLCAEIVDNYTDAPLKRRGGVLPPLPAAALGRAIEQIETGLTGDLRLETLAASASMSPGDFAEAFEIAAGQTLGGFLAQRRVDRVREYLNGAAANDPDDARSLARRFGFGTASTLERAFRAQVGTSLHRYRAKRG